jgi:ferredoxin-NADP reductase/predicted pyridoxine 5'-phosphate oxidase superfamily flavin-nucleotide-binding protein
MKDIAVIGKETSPWHEGELLIQRSAGVAEQMDPVGRRVVRDHLIEQHRDFYPQLPFIAVGSVDPAGHAWATVLPGKPGFLFSPDPLTLHVDARRDGNDPADAGLEDGDAVGLLGIELNTRRRNRLNGLIRRSSAAAFDVMVEQSYGNCPQYIRLRDLDYVEEPRAPPPDSIVGNKLTDRAREMIRRADTLFVATYVDRNGHRRQVDVSHRGGKSGFVRLGDDDILTIPDFAGNLFFNTLGNIIANPSCGLVFVDFDNGDLLHLSGTGTVVLESPEIAAFQGAERLLRFEPRRVVFRPRAFPLHWSSRPDGASPNSTLTGTWEEARQRIRAAELANAWRPLRINRIVEESSVVRSLYFEPTDGAGLIPSLAGQHLPIRLIDPQTGSATVRTYTLSSGPSDEFYRISVKCQGLVSNRLRELSIGDLIEARRPAGSFAIDSREPRPAVLLAAGIGVTPMIAMLRHIIYEGQRTRITRPTWLFYAARSKQERAFDGELKTLQADAGLALRVVRTLADRTGAASCDFESTGRIDIDLLKSHLPFDDYDFFLCGPAAFMQSIYDGLRNLNVSDVRIHAESFGPASLVRQREKHAPVLSSRRPARAPVDVTFTKSGKGTRWTPGEATLLELAEQAGLSPPFSCRIGSCGSCRTRILQGAVAYAAAPSFDVPDDEALLCCALPADGSANGGELHLEL